MSSLLSIPVPGDSLVFFRGLDFWGVFGVVGDGEAGGVSYSTSGVNEADRLMFILTAKVRGGVER